MTDLRINVYERIIILHMKKRIINTIIIIILVILAGAGIGFYIYSNRYIPIPEGYIGNTTGNLNNRGLFCESDGYIYFANVYDQKRLYKMKTDLTDAECIGNVPAEFINVYDNRVYFYQTPYADNQFFGLGGLYGVCSTDTNGKSGVTTVDKTYVNSMVLYGDNLYYQHYDAGEGLTLYKASGDGKSKEKISSKEVFVACPYEGTFLTYDKNNMFYLSFYNPENDTMGLYDEIRAYNIIHEGNYLYYMNIDDSYRIYRYSLSTRESEKLTDYTVDLFNVIDNIIFFQKNSETEPALMRMFTDGSNPEVISVGNYSNINCTSTYTFFNSFSEAAPVYCVPTHGGSAFRFDPKEKK